MVLPTIIYITSIKFDKVHKRTLISSSYVKAVKNSRTTLKKGKKKNNKEKHWRITGTWAVAGAKVLNEHLSLVFNWRACWHSRKKCLLPSLLSFPQLCKNTLLVLLCQSPFQCPILWKLFGCWDSYHCSNSGLHDMTNEKRKSTIKHVNNCHSHCTYLTSNPRAYLDEVGGGTQTFL